MIHVKLNCVIPTKLSVIQIIHQSAGLKCFFSILLKCLFVIIVKHSYFIPISHSSVKTQV